MRSTLVLCACLSLAVVDTACKRPSSTDDIKQDVKVAVEKAGRSASRWSLQQVDKLNHTVATFAARQLADGCDTAIDFLEDPGTQDTAEAVNHYLFDVVLANINPAVGAGIQTAAAILDSILRVPAGQSLTKAELEVLAAFCRGLKSGAQDFLDGKVMSQPPQPRAENHPRFWLCQPLGIIQKSPKTGCAPVDSNRGVLLTESQNNDWAHVGETIPPATVLGVTCVNGDPPGYWGHFGWLITTQWR